MASAAVVSIGTTHPWNIAGVGLDAAVVREHGLRPLTVVAAVSAQDAAGLHALHAVPGEIVAAQLRALPEAGAVRVGALGSAAAALAVARWLGQTPAPVVVDPVMRASLGGELADSPALDALQEVYARPGAVLTPNLDEAAALCGMPVASVADMRAAGAKLRDAGAGAVLVKGGHLDSGTVVDVLTHAGGVDVFEDERLPWTMRGTGCTLAAALACELCAGRGIVEAVERARRYVREKIAARASFASLHVPF